MLEVHQLLGKQLGVMIVDQRYGTDNGRLCIFDSDADQSIADEIAKGFGAIGIPLFCNQPIEARKEIRIDSNADTGELAHKKCSLSRANFYGSMSLKFVLRSLRKRSEK